MNQKSSYIQILKSVPQVLTSDNGGVAHETAPIVVKADTNVLVAGSAVFMGGSVDRPDVYGDNIRAIRASAVAI